MARSNEFTHGGSVGKNVALMLRAILNILAYGVMWFGIMLWIGSFTLFTIPSPIPLIMTIAGAVCVVILLVVNLFGPFAHRVK